MRRAAKKRLPSCKFVTNDAILGLGASAYHCLRPIGQLGLTGQFAPMRHPAKRGGLKTVLQEIMYRQRSSSKTPARSQSATGGACHIRRFRSLPSWRLIPCVPATPAALCGTDQRCGPVSVLAKRS